MSLPGFSFSVMWTLGRPTVTGMRRDPPQVRASLRAAGMTARPDRRLEHTILHASRMTARSAMLGIPLFDQDPA
jgi:hypothetical protein